eukprot:g465.t1
MRFFTCCVGAFICVVVCIVGLMGPAVVDVELPVFNLSVINNARKMPAWRLADVGRGPETCVFDSTDKVFTMTGDGFVKSADVEKVDGGGGVALRHVRDYAYVGGRPLGAAFDIDDNLYIANALTGLQRVNKTNPRVVEILAGRAGGKKIAFADDLCIGNSGTVYFTDACSIGPTRSKDGWETLHPSILEGLRG